MVCEKPMTKGIDNFRDNRMYSDFSNIKASSYFTEPFKPNCLKCHNYLQKYTDGIRIDENINLLTN